MHLPGLRLLSDVNADTGDQQPLIAFGRELNRRLPMQPETFTKQIAELRKIRPGGSFALADGRRLTCPHHEKAAGRSPRGKRPYIS
jgi:hypothetical protein